ncbi:hypothetical protein [Rhodovulum adriaticum]|uniref:Uncharacterized protein n=1 Tax=Rhodovulum adriaticum TaxID=35804 RepID=A0A4R2NHP2_RHOAD|nr:hypothetical protein [Rhodovulum adriaticum]MBK1636964.1 hypothetical protein [Rhodovulum adriaticum]TCP20907.1 hypothetical protein EV656_11528 [Rhodovulum adriaticum]
MNSIADRRAGRIEPPIPIAIVIEQHGAWRVLGVAVAAILDGRGRPGDTRLHLLSNHLRQDIGLPPLPQRRRGPPPWL